MSVLVYVAGPLSATTKGPGLEVAKNIQCAKDAVKTLLHNGAIAPVSPHLLYGLFLGVVPEAIAMEACLSLVLACEAIYLLEGWERSRGSQAEVALMKLRGKKVFPPYQMKDLCQWAGWFVEQERNEQ